MPERSAADDELVLSTPIADPASMRRFDESENQQPADLDFMNEYARNLYIKECQTLLDRINKLIPEDQPKLFLPNLKFNRSIGDFANQPYDLQGNLLPAGEFPAYLETQLPNAADKEMLKGLLKGHEWIAERELKAGA